MEVDASRTASTRSEAWPLQLLPVMDLMGGQVVHGMGGRRSQYRPLQSPLADRPTAACLAPVLARRFSDVYVADLDAIEDRRHDWDSCQEIATAGLRIWLDAGCGDVRHLAAWTQRLWQLQPRARAILGSEAIEGPDQLQQLARLLPAERIVFSLDLCGQRVLSRADASRSDAEREAALDLPGRFLGQVAAWADAARSAGIRRWIVLDLAQVGSGKGPSVLSLCQWLHQRYPDVELISGGGVRDRGDLEQLAKAGCQWALVASALHHGRL